MEQKKDGISRLSRGFCVPGRYLSTHRLRLGSRPRAASGECWQLLNLC